MSTHANTSTNTHVNVAGWTTIRVTPASGPDAAIARETVVAMLFDAGSQGVHEDGDSVVTHFPPDTDVDAVRARIAEALPSADIEVGSAPQVSWDVWRASVQAHDVGALTVAPPWLASEHDPARTIVIDPAMAFGTGEHPTTRGVLRLMQQVIRPGDLVADLGAGSAVLAIAAAKLGARHVVAIELDPDAAGNAQENIDRNRVTDTVTFLEGDASVLLPLVAPVRVVLANIVSSVLLAILPAIGDALAPDGDVILSGILYEEREMMLAQLARAGWRVTAEDQEDAWWSVALTRVALARTAP